MKFAKCLETESVPEWRRAYIHYKNLKKKLKTIEKYRRQHSDREEHELDLAINTMENLHPSVRDSRKHTAISRAQSSTLENRRGFYSMTPGHSTEDVSTLSDTEFVLDQVLKFASEPELDFFHSLDDNMKTIAEFYDAKEKEAEVKFEALEMQVKIIKGYAFKLSRVDSCDEESNTIQHAFHFHHWFRRDSTTSTLPNLPSLPPSIKYNGTNHLNYNLARSRLKKAITEFYRSLELLKSYKVNQKK
ncbi:SPX domain-containing protein [Sporodiniella umbellata]|nr:SPX domain-containing protein [Sporodiniella umbellata]